MFVVYLGYISLVDTSLPLSRYQNTWQTWFRPMNVDKSVSNHPNVCIKIMIWSVFVLVVYLGYISLVDTSLPLSRYQNTWQTWFRPMNVDKSVSNQTYTPIINKQSMSNLQRLNLTWRNSIKPLVLFFKVTSFKTGQKNLFSSETKWNEASELNWTWTTTINFSRVVHKRRRNILGGGGSQISMVQDIRR